MLRFLAILAVCVALPHAAAAQSTVTVRSGPTAPTNAAHAEAQARPASSSFVIRNDTDKVIETILFGQSTSDDWSDNILTNATRPGTAVQVTFFDRLNGCHHDLYYVFADGSDYVERLDVCALDGKVHILTEG